MIENHTAEHDSALDALTNLTDVTRAGTDELITINVELTRMSRQRQTGWSWRRIMSATDVPNPLSVVSTITANLARAAGRFRRSLVRSLRTEGMQVNEIGSLLAVSRQRVSALARHRPTDGPTANAPAE
jgi:hypothetical protein